MSTGTSSARQGFLTVLRKWGKNRIALKIMVDMMVLAYENIVISGVYIIFSQPIFRWNLPMDVPGDFGRIDQNAVTKFSSGIEKRLLNGCRWQMGHTKKHS